MHAAQEDLRRYLEDDLDVADREAISAHLQECTICLDVLQTLSETGDLELAEALRRLPVIPPPRRTQPVESELLHRDRRAGERFRVLRFHKQGGLGRIYVARDEELGREVALKEIRPDRVAEPQFRSRFVLEAEINGGLEHPGIVPVYSLGTYDDGRPFYAMRFVDGGSLKEAISVYHRDHPRPDPSAVEFRKLLGRFVDICEAIAFAHSRGVLHRDLKPGNVMLGRYGETLLIDWGLAKATGRHESDGPVVTSEATLVPPSDSRHAPTVGVLGSPPFMSPEQAAGEVDSLGPSTDVYGLGAILFALLTNEPPVEDGTPDDVLNRTRSGAIRRPRSLNPNIPRPLEAVCLKALSQKPSNRYPSARTLADDLERWLADEPVSVWHEPFHIRARRWARRHRTAVASVMTAILAGSLGSALVQSHAKTVLEAKNLQLTEAHRATNRALNEANTARVQTQAALTQSETSRRQFRAINDFLIEDLLAQAEPAHTSAEDHVTLLEVLDRAADKVGGRFATQPEVEDSLRRTIARTYHGLGSWSKAESQWRAVLESAERRHGHESREALTARSELAHILTDLGRRDPDVIEMASRAAGGLLKVLGPDHPDTLDSRNELAEAYRVAGRTKESLALHEETFKLRKAKLGADHSSTLVSQGNLAKVYLSVGRIDEAIALHENALRQCESTLDTDHPAALESRNNLGVAYTRAGRFAEAIPLLEQTLGLSEARLGANHSESLNTRSNLGLAYLAGGRTDEAIAIHEQTLKQRESTLGIDHPNTLISRGNLAKAYIAGGRAREAVALHEETLKLHESKFGPDNPITLTSRIILASALHVAGRTDEAIAMFEATLKRCESELGADHRETLTCRINLGSVYLAAQRTAEAIALHEATLKLCESKLGPDNTNTLQCRNNLATAYRTAGRTAEAIALHEQTLKLRESKLGPDHPDTLESRSNLAAAYLTVGRIDEAIALHEATLKLQEGKLPLDHPSTLISRGSLAKAYLAAGQVGRAIANFEQTLHGFNTKLGPDHRHTLTTQQLLAEAYTAAGENGRAEPLLRDALERAIRRFGESDPRTANAMASCGSNLIRQNKWTEAEPLLRSCLAIRRKAQADDWSTFHAESMLGGSLLGQKRFAEAEPSILSGYEGMKKREERIPTQAKAGLTEAARRVIQLYESWGKPDEAAQWRLKLELPADEARQ